MAKVLVTGGSGFLGSRCILSLLAAGHEVRTTVRTAERRAVTQAMLHRAGARRADALEFAVADLSAEVGWSEALAGCDFALHVASPHPPGRSYGDSEAVRVARDGTLQVLRAARDRGVKRVVMTSSFAAIGYSGKSRDTPYTERDWTDPQTKNTSYVRSKFEAERAAWSFIKSEGGPTELCVINPVAIFGPVLAKDFAPPIAIIERMLSGGMPAVARVSFGVVDVRDVADLHVTAMTHPCARGERFLAVAGEPLSMLAIADVLRRHFGPAAKRVPRVELADWLVRAMALIRPTMRATVDDLGRYGTSSNAKARRLLGWMPRSSEAAIVATAESLITLGLVDFCGLEPAPDRWGRSGLTRSAGQADGNSADTGCHGESASPPVLRWLKRSGQGS